ncbi:hypothetical protein MBLNU457_4485t1 [Dothideomycetes sp. NU457]
MTTTSPKTTAETGSPQDYAITVISQRCFHQWTTYSDPTGSGKQFKVSFGTTSNFDQPGAARLPTIFILGPMMCSRYMLVYYDYLAVKMGVRLIFMDRPGFGLHDPVPHAQRLPASLAATTAILAHLHVKHVALLSASAGTIYLLATLSSQRSILHPKHPYAAAMVPWVLPKYSHCKLMDSASKLPNSLIASFGGLQKFFVQNVVPSISWSGGVVGQVGNLFSKGEEREDQESKERYSRCFGVSEVFKDEVEKMAIKYLFAEGTGVNDEAPFVLQKNMPAEYWGAASDYEGLVRDLIKSEKGRRSENLHQERLRFRAYFAESDMLIGEGGKEYFERCFRGADGIEEVIDYQSETVPESNHDSAPSPVKGAIEKIFEDVKRGWEDGLDG